MRYSLVVAMAIGACLAAPAVADVVAVKDEAGLSFQVGGGTVDDISDARFLALTGADVVTVTVADSAFYDTGNARWMNQGGSTEFGGPDGTYSDWILSRFDLAALPGFSGGTIHYAELRFHSSGGSLSHGGVGPIVSQAWDEGNKTGAYGDYPGKDLTGSGGPPPAAGVSYAHPTGMNTTSYRDRNDGTDDPIQSWGDGNDFFSPSAFSGSPGGVAPVDGVHPGDGDTTMQVSTKAVKRPSSNGYEGWFLYDVTAIVEDWADGSTANYGLYMAKGARQHTRDSGSDTEPVLFLDYTPLPEPTTLGLLALGSLGLSALRRRRK